MNIEEAYKQIASDEWEKWAFGPKRAPLGFVHIYWWADCADVVVLRSRISATAYRARIRPNVHPFSPEIVDWFFSGPTGDAIEKLKKIPAPGATLAPRYGYDFKYSPPIPKTWLEASRRRVSPSNRSPRL